MYCFEDGFPNGMDNRVVRRSLHEELEYSLLVSIERIFYFFLHAGEEDVFEELDIGSSEFFIWNDIVTLLVYLIKDVCVKLDDRIKELEKICQIHYLLHWVHLILTFELLLRIILLEHLETLIYFFWWNIQSATAHLLFLAIYSFLNIFIILITTLHPFIHSFIRSDQIIRTQSFIQFFQFPFPKYIGFIIIFQSLFLFDT